MYNTALNNVDIVNFLSRKRDKLPCEKPRLMLQSFVWGFKSHTHTHTVCGGRGLGHCAKHGIVATDARSVLVIVPLCVTHFIKLRLQGEMGKKRGKIIYCMGETHEFRSHFSIPHRFSL